jgi:hypothetical protein
MKAAVLNERYGMRLNESSWVALSVCKQVFAKAIRAEDQLAPRNPQQSGVEWGNPAEVMDASTDM